MTRRSRLPLPARCLLRLSPVPRENRGEVQGDLHELFAARRTDRGAVHAHWRLYHDVASLWFQSAPAVHTSAPRSLLALLTDARIDLRYAVRLFVRQPAILLLTIVGLSLGLGIATAAFSIMNAATLRGEGLVDPDRVPGVLRTTEHSVATGWRYDEFLRLREGSTRMQVEGVLTGAAATRTGPADGTVPAIDVAFVSGGFFAATGGRMTLGRPLEAADAQHLGPPPVVVSFVFWTSRLDRDPAVVGRTIKIGRADATVVGVAARGFAVPNNRLLWMPLTAYGAVYDAAPVKRTPESGVQVFGRLLPGVTLAEAEAQLSGVAAGLPAASPAPDAATARDSVIRVRLDPDAGLGRADTRAVAVFVFAVIALVLVLASANVGTVLISTAITREREMGVRAALGASRGRIVRQLVTESLALGTVAAMIGLLVAYWGLPTIGTMIEAPAGTDLTPDLTVYLFLGIVTVATGVGAGLAPAWHGRGADLVTPLKGEGAGPNRVAPRRLRFVLVMTQSAISVLLIVMATLFVRATVRTATIDVGFDAAGLYGVSPGLGDAFDPARGAAIKDFWRRAIPELQATPGIRSVTLSDLTPFGGPTRTATTSGRPSRIVNFNRARHDYFETIGLRMLAGRTFTRDEVAAKAAVALVSQSLARTYWPDRSPIGQMLPDEIPVAKVPEYGLSGTRPMVIGVVADAITERLHDRNAFAVYEPLDPASERFAQLLIRVAPGASGVMEQASQRLRALEPRADVSITSVSALLQQEAARPRMFATLTGVVGLIAIVLCVIGLYGLTGSVVGQRAREMAVRAALGAETRDLLRLLMWDSLRPVVLGLAAGGGVALLAGRVVAAAMIFGVSPQDPIAFAGAAAILLAAAILAVLVPTRRAATVDASFVLRQS